MSRQAVRQAFLPALPSNARQIAVFWLALNLSAASLDQQIARLLEASNRAHGAFWGIHVLDLHTGKTLYSRNADRFFIPASNAKLFIAALALQRLGPDFRFQTRVLAAVAPDSQGRISGSLRLVGGGDPNLSARAVPYRMGPPTGDPLAPIEDLADQIASRGVKRIDGGIIGDDTWYVWQPYPEGWAAGDLLYDYGAPVSALTINDNTISLSVHAGTHAADLAELSIAPPIEYYDIDNRVTTVAAGGERKIQFERLPGSRQLRVWGTIPVRAPDEILAIAIDDPAEYAAIALRRALEERGVTVAGSAVAEHRFANQENGSPPAEAFELAHRDSAPLIDDLGITSKVSQNLHAELALRAVARAAGPHATREAGLEELKTFLTSLDIRPESYSFNDGSGLDRADLVTPEAVVKLLSYMYNSPSRESWISLLPVAGRDGTLSARFGDGPASGRIFAKTGSLAHVSSLSGYALRRNGDWLAFSILVNNYNAPVAEIRGIIDRICTLILE